VLANSKQILWMTKLYAYLLTEMT